MAEWCWQSTCFFGLVLWALSALCFCTPLGTYKTLALVDEASLNSSKAPELRTLWTLMDEAWGGGGAPQALASDDEGDDGADPVEAPKDDLVEVVPDDDPADEGIELPPDALRNLLPGFDNEGNPVEDANPELSPTVVPSWVEDEEVDFQETMDGDDPQESSLKTMDRDGPQESSLNGPLKGSCVDVVSEGSSVKVPEKGFSSLPAEGPPPDAQTREQVMARIHHLRPVNQHDDVYVLSNWCDMTLAWP